MAFGPRRGNYRIQYPIFKEGTVYTPLNYRGVHLPSVLSKVAERFIGRSFLRYCDAPTLFDPRRRAIRNRDLSETGASQRFMIVFIALWLLSACRRFCVWGVSGDIFGAFHRMSIVFLFLRLRPIGTTRAYLEFVQNVSRLSRWTSVHSRHDS